MFNVPSLSFSKTKNSVPPTREKDKGNNRVWFTTVSTKFRGKGGDVYFLKSTILQFEGLKIDLFGKKLA